MNHMPPRRTHGLTLTELLITLALIAVLIALLVPTVRIARVAAQRSTCASNLRQIGNAFALYAADHRVYPVVSWSNNLSPGTPFDQLTWIQLIAPHLGAKDPRVTPLRGAAAAALTCPVIDAPRSVNPTGYGMNPYFAAEPGAGLNTGFDPNTGNMKIASISGLPFNSGVFARPAQWTHPSEKLLVSDSVTLTHTAWPWPWWEPPNRPMPSRPDPQTFTPDFTRHPPFFSRSPSPNAPAINTLFADLHVELISARQAHHAITFQPTGP